MLPCQLEGVEVDILSSISALSVETMRLLTLTAAVTLASIRAANNGLARKPTLGVNLWNVRACQPHPLVLPVTVFDIMEAWLELDFLRMDSNPVINYSLPQCSRRNLSPADAVLQLQRDGFTRDCRAGRVRWVSRSRIRTIQSGRLLAELPQLQRGHRARWQQVSRQ